MPTLTIGDQKVTVGDEFMKLSPEQQNATVDEIAKSLPKKEAAPQRGAISDVASSFGRGISKGAISLAGLPGDVSQLVGKGVEKAGEFLGAAPRPVPKLSGMPTSADITGGVESVTGEFGKPETRAGRYAESVGEFVPSAVIGPGGPLTKAATTLAGGLGAEAGGEVAGAPGRFVGGFIGGAGAGVAGAETQAKRLSAALPGIAENKQSAKAAYDAIANARLSVSPGAVTTLSDGIRTALDQDLIVGVNAPRSFKAIEQLDASGGDMAQIMGVYEKLGKITAAEGTEYAAASRVRESIGDFIENVPPQEVIAGDPKFTAAMWDHAKASWRAAKKMEEIEKAAERGERTAASSGTGANVQNALRQKMRAIIDSDKKSRGFSPETKAKIEEIVEGTWASNTARFIGKYAPSGPVSTWATVLTGLEAGVPAAAAVGIGTTLAKHLGTYLTRRQIQQLQDMIAAESPLGKPIAAAQQRPNFGGIAPAAALRSELATQAASPLAAPGQ